VAVLIETKKHLIVNNVLGNETISFSAKVAGSRIKIHSIKVNLKCKGAEGGKRFSPRFAVMVKA